jgi:hypothetical protein
MEVAELLTDNFIKNQETSPARKGLWCLRFGFAFIKKLFKPYLEYHYLQGIPLMLWYVIRYPFWISVVFEINVVAWMRL